MKLHNDLLVPTDLHAHTTYSDGILSVSESIEKRVAIAEVIGISDHFHYFLSDANLWDSYLSDIAQAKATQKNRKILTGLEIMFSDLLENFNLIPFQQLDYIILEHFENYTSFDVMIKGLERVKAVFEGKIILAHPDFHRWAILLGESNFRLALEYLKKHHIILEINVNQGYLFIEGDDDIEQLMNMDNPYIKHLKETDTIISIGSDAHGYEELLFRRFKRIYQYFLDQIKENANG